MEEKYLILERCPGNKLRVRAEAVPELLALLAVFQHRFEAGAARAARAEEFGPGPGSANNGAYYKNAASAIDDLMFNLRNPIREANLRVAAICIAPLVRRLLGGWTPGTGLPLELPSHVAIEPDRRANLPDNPGGGGAALTPKPRGKGERNRPGRGRSGGK